ncbi:MAG: hypothetical protein HY690_04250 [Chloroflexi bacterium]|nr:hypothetical protein [Chloroflexota bacterium]
MHSSLISKIQKANLYAREPERVQFTELSVQFQGEHDTYTVTYQAGRWHCTCHSFPAWGICSHAMAIEKLMGRMLPREAHDALSFQSGALASG